MKNGLLCLMLAIAASFANFVFAREIRDVVIEPDAVHVPLGFDSNDKNVQVMVTGVTRDSCTEQPQGSVKIMGQKISIQVTAKKVMSGEVMCTQVLKPYLVAVDLGPLREGNYEIRVNEGKPSEKDSVLSIDKPTSPTTDNFVYANITSVVKAPEKSALIISGAHRSSCMNLDHVDIIPNDNGNTVAILPIVQQGGEICDFALKPFKYEVPVASSGNDESIVFHIRSFAGKAINVRW